MTTLNKKPDPIALGNILRRILTETTALYAVGSRTTKPYAKEIQKLTEDAIKVDDESMQDHDDELAIAVNSDQADEEIFIEEKLIELGESEAIIATCNCRDLFKIGSAGWILLNRKLENMIHRQEVEREVEAQEIENEHEYEDAEVELTGFRGFESPSVE